MCARFEQQRHTAYSVEELLRNDAAQLRRRLREKEEEYASEVGKLQAEFSSSQERLSNIEQELVVAKRSAAAAEAAESNTEVEKDVCFFPTLAAMAMRLSVVGTPQSMTCMQK
ncbi:hypothetical protein CYMTET_9059 [Cymbomonas tetramitiformis]|uniref:Uncharacterized protein n=1 Tax=Cymbomonas tetramitiformis TaxID=36881 RepID=A0AAE0GSI0_9CHLO|nr:hypothetical protein CYMTET_9059 [Cymbomonas tetramitiformis]